MFNELMVSVIIASYNFEKNDWIHRCLNSLRNSTSDCNIIVVDNNSSDNTVMIIKEEYPEVVLIEQTENLGFARANNIGIKYAYNNGASFYFLLNQDAWVEKDTIEKLVSALEDNPDYGIISPMHLNSEGSRIDEYFEKYLKNCVKDYKLISSLYFNQTGLFETSFANAATWLVSRKCIETVGGFDTSLFVHYGEDDNYCQRVLFHKLKIGVYTGAAIFHDRNSNTRGGETSGIVAKKQETGVFIKYGNINARYKLINHPLIYGMLIGLRNIFEADHSDWNAYKYEYRIIKLYKNRIIKSRAINSTAGKGKVWFDREV